MSAYDVTGRLVAMANQIALSVPDREHAAQRTAEHLRAFWAPSMLEALDAHVAEHGDDVSAEVHDALAILRGAPAR